MVVRRKMMSTAAIGALGVAVSGAFVIGDMLVSSAHADSLFLRDRNVNVRERERPEFAAPGIRAGQFIVRPRLDLSAGYNSNVFALSNAPASAGLEDFEDQSDYFFIARPSVHAETLWSRHGLSAGAYTELYAHERFNSEAIRNEGAYLNGQLDISRETAFFGGISFDRLNESRRVNNGAALTDEPVRYERAAGYAGVSHEQGRFRYRGRFDVANFDFDDVDSIAADSLPVTPERDQDFRDRTAYSVLGQVSFAVTRDVAIFVRGVSDVQRYDRETDAFGRSRDSEGYTFDVGAEFDVTQLIRGEVGVGYFSRDYDDPAFEKAEGVGVRASLEWFPTELTTVSLTAERDAEESAFIAAGGFVSTEVVARVDRELRRNLLAYAFAGYGTQDYPDQLSRSTDGTPYDQEVERYGGGVGLEYFANRHVSVRGGYTYEAQDVGTDVFEGGFDTDYDAHQVLVTVSLKR